MNPTTFSHKGGRARSKTKPAPRRPRVPPASETIAALLGVPVHVLTRESVEQLTNPYRRESILADAREIFRA